MTSNYCEGFNEARVLFRYSSTAPWDTFTSNRPPITYTLTQQTTNSTPGQCDCSKYQIVINYRRTTGQSSSTAVSAWGPIGQITSFNERDSNSSNYREGFNISCRGLVNSGSSFGCTGGSANTTCGTLGIHKKVVGCGGATSPVIITSVTITALPTYPDNCGGQSTCTLTVNDATGIVFTKTAATCPEVKVECGRRCPPSTCECVCSNNRVCCYNAQGIAVASFPA